jgi:hypothetical protein
MTENARSEATELAVVLMIRMESFERVGEAVDYRLLVNINNSKRNCVRRGSKRALDYPHDSSRFWLYGKHLPE